MTDARLTGEVRVSWQTLLDAVCRHAAEAPAGTLAGYDAEKLIGAANNVLCRVQEALEGGSKAVRLVEAGVTQSQPPAGEEGTLPAIPAPRPADFAIDLAEHYHELATPHVPAEWPLLKWYPSWPAAIRLAAFYRRESTRLYRDQDARLARTHDVPVGDLPALRARLTRVDGQLADSTILTWKHAQSLVALLDELEQLRSQVRTSDSKES